MKQQSHRSGTWVALCVVGSLWMSAQTAEANPTFTETMLRPIRGVSADGGIAIGNYGQGGARWAPDVGLGVFFPPGNPSSDSTMGVSATGTTFAGQATYNGVTRGYRFAAGSYELFDNVAGGSLTVGPTVDGISGDGQWVLGTTRSANGTAMPGVWSSSTGWRLHGLLPGSTGGFSEDSNFDASVVVGRCIVGFLPIGYRWSAEAGIQPLPTFIPGQSSIPREISDDGNVIVGSVGTTPVRWIGTGAPIAIPGAIGTAYATNLAGTLIGGGSIQETQLSNDAFLWDPQNGTRLLKDVLTQLGLPVASYNFNQVRGISNDGTVIVANFWQDSPFGVRRGSVYITIPVPPTLVLGFAVVLAGRRRR